MNRPCFSLILAALCSLAAPALAQDVKEGTGTGIKAATTGTTDVTSDKMQAKEASEAKDATELSLSAGLLLADGNAKTQAYTVSEKLRVRRENNQFKQAFAANYARAGAIDTTTGQVGDVVETVRNFQGLVRFDHFLGDVTLFLSTQARHDRFQGLNLRLQVDPGVAYYFINKKEQLFWVELGYDFTLDKRTDVAVSTARQKAVDKGSTPEQARNSIKDTRTLHSARAFVGYEQALSETSKLNLGLEYLQGLASNEKDTSKAYRLNFDAALTAKVYKALSVATTYSLRVDSAAEQIGKKKTDQMLAASLVYTVL